ASRSTSASSNVPSPSKSTATPSRMPSLSASTSGSAVHIEAVPSSAPMQYSIPGSDGRAARGVPPFQQFVDGLVVAQRPALHPQFLEVVPRPPDLRTGRDVEQLHDLVAVEVGPDPLEVLLGGQLRDAC